MRVEIDATDLPGLARALTAGTGPEGLGPRGAALWEELAKLKLDAGRRVLAEEMCRVADRMETLDKILQGDGEVWAYLVTDLFTEETSLKINGAVSEARAQQDNYRKMLATLYSGLDLKAAEPVADPLAAMREARARRVAGG